MNRIAYTRAISLIGKLAAKSVINPSLLTTEEQELVRQCLEEYKFYHAHEPELRTNPDDFPRKEPEFDSVKREAIKATRKGN